jgi:cytochrome c oxidase cbb3-type subunit 4
MTDQTLLEEIWANRTLVWLFTAFIVAVLFAFRPGSGKVHRDSANIPFRHDDKPAADTPAGPHKEARP